MQLFREQYFIKGRISIIIVETQLRAAPLYEVERGKGVSSLCVKVNLFILLWAKINH
jgi:hypothetical protein